MGVSRRMTAQGTLPTANPGCCPKLALFRSAICLISAAAATSLCLLTLPLALALKRMQSWGGMASNSVQLVPWKGNQELPWGVRANFKEGTQVPSQVSPKCLSLPHANQQQSRMKPTHGSLCPHWGELSALSENLVKGSEVPWVCALHLEFPVSGCMLSTLLPGILRQKLPATSQDFWDGHTDRPPLSLHAFITHTYADFKIKAHYNLSFILHLWDRSEWDHDLVYTHIWIEHVCVYIKEIYRKSHLPQKPYYGKFLSIYFHFRSIFTGWFILKQDGGNS